MYLKTDLKRARWVRKTSEEFAGQTYINALVEFNGKIYGGSYPTPLLLEWNGADDWIMRSGEVGTPPDEELGIESLAVFNGKIYGGTHPRGKLAEWNGSNAWAEVAGQYGSETQIFALAVYDGKLYGASHPGGKLLEWNGSNAWVERAPKHGDETRIQCLRVFNGKLYAGTYPHGKLLEWNGSNAWVEKAGQPSGETQIASLCEFDGGLYGGGATGKLYKWNGSDAWVQVAAAVAAIPIWTLTVFKDKLIGCTGNGEYGGTLLEWNGSDAWMLKIATPLHYQTICSAIVYDDNFYAGTQNGAMLFQLDWDKPDKADALPEDELEIYVLPKTAQADAGTISRYQIKPLSYTFKRFIQDERLKPRELEIIIDRKTPIALFNRVIAIEAGQIVFNGYIERQTSKTKEKRKFLCKGNEGHLFGRFMPKLVIQESFYLKPIISDILWMADSYWPPGTPYYIHDHSKNIVMLKYGDTKTDLSNSVLSIRERGSFHKLTAYPNLSDLQNYDYSYYVSANNEIYIRVSGSNWYSVGGLYADRLFDTRCRLGSAHRFETFSSLRLLSTDHEEVATFLFKVLRANNFYMTITDDFNYTYINYERTIGRETDQIIYEKDLLDFDESTPASPHVKSLICRGESYQFASVMDGTSESNLFAIESYPGTFVRPLGMLKDVSREAFQSRNAEGTTEITCERRLLQSLGPGDTFLLKLDDEDLKRIQIAQLTTSSDGKAKAQLGSRVKGISDFWKDKLSSNVYEDSSLQQVFPDFSQSVTFKPRDIYHSNCSLGSIQFTFPSGYLGPSGYGPRFLALLNLSLSVEDAYAAGPNPWKFLVTINGKMSDWGNMSEVRLGEGLQSVDITDLLVEGTNTIEILAQFSSEFSIVHSSCTDGVQYFNLPWMGPYREWKGHPDMNANVTIKFYQMLGAL